MLKIFNRRAPSFFEYLALQDIPGIRRLYKFFYPNGYESFEASLPEQRKNVDNAKAKVASAPISEKAKAAGFLLLLSFQPLADLLKGFVHTFRPYKSTHHFLSDLAQPLRGIGNILKGLLTLFSISLIFAADIVGILLEVILTLSPKPLIKLPTILINCLSCTIDAALTVARGLIQIITTPLTWLAKIPLRGILTGILGKPAIQNDRGINRLLENEDKWKKTKDRKKQVEFIQNHTNLELERKYNKAKHQGRPVPEISKDHIEIETLEKQVTDEKGTTRTVQEEIIHINYSSFFRNLEKKPEPTYPKIRATMGFLTATAGAGLVANATNPTIALMVFSAPLTPHVALALLAIGLFLAAVGTAMFIHGLVTNCQQPKAQPAQALSVQ